MTPIWKYCLAKFYVINLSIHEDPKNNWRVPFKIQYFARFSLVSLSIHPSSRRGAERIRLGRGALEPPPKDGAGTKPFDPEFQFRESHAEAETTTNSWPNSCPLKNTIILYICIHRDLDNLPWFRSFWEDTCPVHDFEHSGQIHAWYLFAMDTIYIAWMM